ncbi:phage protease [Sulfurimonas sp.]|uniref:phage protease n=1 Tax=Sulfurimonas sp. TaxID=2022749 RepID=UPI002B48DD65|nr:phage protease [Sulfurimonas sp.]
MEDENQDTVLLVELNYQEDQKVKISPIGDVVGVDGRSFKIDANEVLKNTEKNGIDLSLNENHWGSKAHGWFALNSLEVRDDGIYANLSLNDLGKPAVENKHYRYLSPEYMIDRNRNVFSIIGVGLVNAPNLLNKALNKQENKKEDNSMEKELNDLKNQNTILTQENNTLLTQVSDKDKTIADLTTVLKTEKTNNAIAGGSLLPAQQEFALSLEINQLDSYLATLSINKQQNNAMGDELDVNQENNSQSDSEKDVFSQLGIGE